MPCARVLQIKHVVEMGISKGYNASFRETVFHPKNSSIHDPVSFSGPTRRQDLRRYLAARRKEKSPPDPALAE
jgi:hypothetical protein